MKNLRSEDRPLSSTDVPSPIDSSVKRSVQRQAQPIGCAHFGHAAAGATGRSFPLGATVFPEGVNFSVYSREASRVELLLFENGAASHPARVISLDPYEHRSYHYWHVFVTGIGPGQCYAYRAAGPFDPDRGLRFDPRKALIDPDGRAVIVSRRSIAPISK